MGWVFPASDTEEPGAQVDPLNGAKSIRELYEIASTNYAGKYSVPVCLFKYIFQVCCAVRLLVRLIVFAYYMIGYMFDHRFFGIKN